MDIIDSSIQTPITSIPKPVSTSSRRQLPSVPPTPLNVTNILSASNIPLEVDISTPTATANRRRLPETPSLVSPTTDYKQCSRDEVKLFLAGLVRNTSKQQFCHPIPSRWNYLGRFYF